MTPDSNDCGVTMHLITHQIVWNTRHECLRHRQNLLCSIHTASRVTSCVVWFTRLFKVSLMLYQCHARFISLSQLLPVLDAHFVYIRSLSLPLEWAVTNTIQLIPSSYSVPSILANNMITSEWLNTSCLQTHMYYLPPCGIVTFMQTTFSWTRIDQRR